MANYSRLSKMDYYFGRNNYKSHRKDFCSYKSVINDDLIIVRSNNVVSRKRTNSDGFYEIEYVLMIGNDLAVWVPYYNIHRSAYIDENDKLINCHLVKLERKYFKPIYYPHETDKKIVFEGQDTFDSLKEQARLQGLQKRKVRF